MKSFKYILSFLSILFLFSAAAAQVSPVPSPMPPLPPASNPASSRPDTSSVHFTPAPVQNSPNPGLNPVPQPFPKSSEDTLFRSIDTPARSPFGTDSIK